MFERHCPLVTVIEQDFCRVCMVIGTHFKLKFLIGRAMVSVVSAENAP